MNMIEKNDRKPLKLRRKGPTLVSKLKVLITPMSLMSRCSTLGRCTFTATSRPVRNVALCTCAIEALPKGSSSKASKTSFSGKPPSSSSSTTLLGSKPHTLSSAQVLDDVKGQGVHLEASASSTFLILFGPLASVRVDHRAALPRILLWEEVAPGGDDLPHLPRLSSTLGPMPRGTRRSP